MTTIKIDLKDIEKASKEYKSLDEVKKALKSVQSIKCRLIKQKERKDYEVEYSKIVLKEQILKEVRSLFEPKKQFVTTYTKEDVEKLTYDETIKAIKSIQSKKCLEQHSSDKTELNRALEIEKMLLEHKENVKPIEDNVVKKTDIETIKNQIENMNEKVSKEYVLELLSKLTNQE